MTTLELDLNKLTKWRVVFTGWQLGTRVKGDPEADAVRDHREATILLRAEISALVNLLVEKKIISWEEWSAALQTDAELLDKRYEQRFPGFKTSQYGVDIDVRLAQETTKGWRP